MLKLMFIWRLLLLSPNSIYKKVLLIRIAYHINQPGGIHNGPVNHMLDMTKKYGVAELFNSSIRSGVYESKASFKNRIQKVVQQYEHDSLIASLLMYKRIPNIPLQYITICMWFWWKYGSMFPSKLKKIRILARILFGETCLQADIARFTDVHCRSCHWCPGAVVEDCAHMLFNCEGLSDIRPMLWQNAESYMPTPMARYLDTCSAKDKLQFILTGFNCSKYCPEWEMIYNALLDYVYIMYNKRRCMEL